MTTSSRIALLAAVVCLPFAVACSSDGPTADTQAPEPVTVTPTGTGVDRATNITVTFSEPIDPASVTDATFTVTPTGGNPISGTIAVAGATATFTPAALLAYGTTYSVRLTPGIRDLAGNPMGVQHSWSFTTAANPPPAVVTVTRLHGAADVARKTTVVATFSEQYG